MGSSPSGGLDITAVWRRFNDDLIRLVDYVPEDKINWSPKPELWNFRGILIHIAGARDGWLTHTVKDGDDQQIYQTVRTKDDIKAAYASTWKRVEAFLRNQRQLDTTYEDDDPDHSSISGHWIAFHLLEHDVHHRADIFHYLALLGIETPDVGTP